MMFEWKIVFTIFLFLHAFQNLPICLKALHMEFILAEISEALELQYEFKLPKCRPPVLAVPKLENKSLHEMSLPRTKLGWPRSCHYWVLSLLALNNLEGTFQML